MSKQANTTIIERTGKTDGKANDKTGVPNFNGHQFVFTDPLRGVVYLKPAEVKPMLPAKFQKLLAKEPVKVAEYLMGRKITLAIKLDTK